MDQNTSPVQQIETMPQNMPPLIPHKKNIYPVVRHIFLIACILCALSFIIFLMYQNGKSIYDNGI